MMLTKSPDIQWHNNSDKIVFKETSGEKIRLPFQNAFNGNTTINKAKQNLISILWKEYVLTPLKLSIQ